MNPFMGHDFWNNSERLWNRDLWEYGGYITIYSWFEDVTIRMFKWALSLGVFYKEAVLGKYISDGKFILTFEIRQE